MTSAFADIGVDLDLSSNLAALVDRQARATPQAVAMVTDRDWTYAELHARMMHYVRALAAYDLAPETTVAVLVPRDAEMVALLLAILWSGAAYVPIDPDDPADRGLRILEVAGCGLIVAAQPWLDKLRAAAGTAELPPCVDPLALDAPAETPLPPCAPGGNQLAYVLFTSGSTGLPKGVEIEHRQVVNLLLGSRELLEFTAADRYLALATIAFDVSLAEIFLPLITGGSFVLRDRALLRDPALLSAEVRRHDVSVVQLGPSTWSVVLAEDPDFPHVRCVVSTGEPIAPALAARLSQVADLGWNLYGPTETTVWVTGHRLSPDDANPGPLRSTISAPIGKAFPRYTAHIVDEAGDEVPVGEVGELLVSGAGLARGYRGRPDLTEAAFITHAPTGQRRYRTGDLVRRGDDGVIHYFGRNDDQIKVRGNRIEPREIETAVLRLPEVAQTAATWYETPSGSRNVVAAIVWEPGRSLPFDRLYARLGEWLPPAIIPSRFITVDELPHTSSGKVDRKAIRAAVEQAGPDDTPDQAALAEMSDVERRLSGIWGQVLGTGFVARDAHFFSAGGDSLSAVSMLLDVERAYGVELDPQTIWEAPRLYQLANVIEHALAQPDDLRNTRIVFPLVRKGDGAPLFFSNVDMKFAHPGLWKAGCPLYALTQWAHGQGIVKAGSIAEIARAQIAEIKRIEPEGPYRLAGYSLGGLIAYELAQQLRAAGDEVELLFLLDPMMPPKACDASGTIIKRPTELSRRPLGQRLAGLMRDLTRPPEAGPGTVRNRLTEALRRTELWQWATYRLVDWHGRKPSALTRALLPRYRWPAFWYAAGKLAQDYVAKPYDGPCLAVFHDGAAPRDVWASLLTGPVDLRLIQATHLSMFTDPELSTWMEMLSDHFARAACSQAQPRAALSGGRRKSS